jgi:spore coat polysaccharide biosynthesis protein SpsF
MKLILGKPMLELMIERVRGSYLISDIVVATTESSLEIVRLADAMNCGVFVGSEDDVLGRVLGAAREYDADIIVELTGDCPLIDPAMIDKVVADYLLGGADFVWNNTPYGAPRGMDVRVFSTDALARVDKLTDDPVDREHVSLYFWENLDRFLVRVVHTEFFSQFGDYRLCVDTSDDFEVVRFIFESFRDRPFDLSDIFWLDSVYSELLRTNSHVEQKAIRET